MSAEPNPATLLELANDVVSLVDHGFFGNRQMKDAIYNRINAYLKHHCGTCTQRVDTFNRTHCLTCKRIEPPEE